MPGSASSPDILSLARLLETRREEILQRWMKRVEGRLASSGLSRPELRDSLPEFLQEIVAELRRQEPHEPPESSPQVAAVAEEHGKQRYRLGSNINAVIWEYSLLRDVLLEIIQETGNSLAVAQWSVISHAITTGIAEAVSHFAAEREKALRESEARLRAIIDQASAFIYLKDAEGRYLLANTLWEKTFHGGRDVRGKTDHEVFPRKTADELRANDLQVLRSNTSMEAEEQHGARTYLSLKFPLVDGEGRPYAVCGISTDITEKKRTQAAREFFLEAGRVLSGSLELNATLRGLASLVAERLADYCLVDLLGEDGQLRRLATASRDEALLPLLERMKAYPPRPGSASPLAQALASGEPVFAERFPPDWLDRATLNAEHRALLAAISPKSVVFVPLIARGRKLGLINLGWTRQHAVPIERYVKLARGVADQAALAIDNARLYQQAQEAARVREEVVAIVSHDLRNPLAAITMSTTVLLKREDLSPAVAKGLSRISAAADRAARMINDLLDFTQARVGSLPLSPRPASFFELARHVVEEVQLAHPERDIHLRTDGDGQGVWDVDRVAQVLTNLVGNAVQHSPSDTPVRVVARGEGEEVVLEVRNQGNPIPPDVLPRLFEPFHRGRSASAGRGSVGLGLYISHQVVLGHGGRIDVRSTASEGTTFTVRLPRHLAARPSAPAP